MSLGYSDPSRGSSPSTILIFWDYLEEQVYTM